MVTGFAVEPFWSPVGAGPACGLGSGVGCAAAAAGLGDAAAPGDAAGLTAGDGDGDTDAEGDATGETAGAGAVVGLGAAVGAGAVVACAAGAAGWQAASTGSNRTVAESTANARATRRCIFVRLLAGNTNRPAHLLVRAYRRAGIKAVQGCGYDTGTPSAHLKQ
jgi:hypothetical protein